MTRLTRTARTVHRLLAYVLFAQLTIWIVGGLTFAVVPFERLIKGGAVTEPVAAAPFPGDWMARIAPHVAALGGVDSLSATDSSQGLLMTLRAGDEHRWVRLSDGLLATRPGSDEIAVYAASLYHGEGSIGGVRHLAGAEYRYFGLVDELYGRSDVWQVSFTDSLGTRLYFDAATGRYLTVRNDLWVLYDAMWRLHIMDYAGGEDFNNTLLRVFTPLALLFALSGVYLTGSSALRARRRRAR